MSDEHSLFSASGAHGWMICHGKILMEEGRRTSSRYAEEGTAAHDLAARVLGSRIKGGVDSAQKHIGERIKAGEYEFVVDNDMADHVDTYVDGFMAMANARNAVRMVEQRVHYHTWLGVPKSQAFGTGDGIAILYDQPAIIWNDTHFPPGDELQVHDLKYGAGVKVYVDGPQLKLYGLGALYDFDEVSDNITRVRMVIHQPRKDHVDELVMSVDDLKAWAAEPAAAAQKVLAVYALKAEGLGVVDVAEHLHPDEKACRFCDAKAICPALKAEVRDTISGGSATADDFSDLTIDPPAEVRDYGGNFLANVAGKLDLIEQWLKAVKEERNRRVLNGQGLTGWKAVAGSLGDRKYKEPGSVELHLKKRPAEVREVMFTRKLLSPAQAEKALKKAAPAEWALLQQFITRETGAPTVVPVTDPRAEFVRVTANDFEDLTEQPVAEGAATGNNSHPFR